MIRVSETEEVEAPKYLDNLVLFAICEVDVVLEAPEARHLRHRLGLGFGTSMDEIHLNSNASNQTRRTIYFRMALRA